MVAAAALLAAARAAAAEGLTLRLEPTYSATSVIATDQTGARTASKTQALDQAYRLTLDRSLSPTLRFGAGGLFNWQLGWSELPERSSRETQTWTGDARLTFQDGETAAGLRYDRRDESLESRTLGQLVTGPGLANEQYTLFARWSAEDRPKLDLRASHGVTWDQTRSITDRTVDQATLNASYAPAPGLDLRYGVQFTRPQDRVGNFVSTQLGQTARAGYAQPFARDRGQLSVSYTLNHRLNQTVTTSGGGRVASQRFPTRGLSTVEALPSPEQGSLNSNPALIDGSFEAGAGLDLGFGRTLAGDNRFRDMGAELADPTTSVNRIDVYVDEPLPVEVAATLTWLAYRSDDNQTWTPVPLFGSVRFEPFVNRFEIPIAPGPGRYLKVVTRPLLPSITSDPRLESVFVTELQLLEETTAEEAEARGRVSSLGGLLSTSATYRLLRGPDLMYDNSVSLSHANDPSFEYAWTMVNGMSYGQRLHRMLMLRARLDRSDTDARIGHSADNRLSATLVADPIPAVTAAATASGQISQTPLGTGHRETVSLMTRLDPYRGVNLGANGTVTFGTNELGQATRGRLLGTSLSLLPHPKATVAASYSFSEAEVSGGGLPARSTTLQSLEGTLSYQPFRALFASLGATRTISGGPPATLASVVVGFSPFPDGSLLVRGAYSDTLDTFSDLRTRTMGPSMRWNIVRGSYLDLSYTRQETFSPVGDSLSRGFFANLVVTPIG